MKRADAVVDAIMTMIKEGEFEPGDKLPVESELCARLGLARSSLREGVKVLTTMGVLTTRQGDGTYVTSLEPDLLFGALAFATDVHGLSEQLDTLVVRRVLETEAAGEAATRITAAELEEAAAALEHAQAILASDEPDADALMETDRHFHEVIAKASGNKVLSALISALGGRTNRARTWRHMQEAGASDRSLAEHRAILGALAAQDATRARTLMAVHLLAVEDFTRAAGLPDISDTQHKEGTST